MATGIDRKTTKPGFVNRNRQLVTQRLPANGDDPRVYVVCCLNPECNHLYGAVASSLTHRRCPNCQGGRPGLPVPPPKTSAEVLADIAAMPPSEGPDPYEGMSHDEVLYGPYGIEARHDR